MVSQNGCHKQRQSVQWIHACKTCDPERLSVRFILFQLMLIVICDDKTAQYEKETDSNESFLEEMRIEKVVYNIAVRPKNHHGENETQGCQCIYHIDAIKRSSTIICPKVLFSSRNSATPSCLIQPNLKLFINLRYDR